MRYVRRPVADVLTGVISTLETSFDEQITHSENQAQEADCVTTATVPQGQRKTGRTRRPVS